MKVKKEYKRILIFEVNWLGDVLFSTPFIRAIRERFKTSYIACLVHPRALGILEGNPYIDEILIYDENRRHKSLLGKLGLISLLRRKDFDLAILLHRSFTRAFITVLSGIKERAGFVTSKRRVLLTRPIEIPDETLHKVDYFLKIAENLDCDISNKDYEFFIRDVERKYIKEELSKNNIEEGDLLVVINPGANWPPKRWSEENYAKLSDILITKYKAKVVVSGAEKDVGIANRIGDKMGKSLAVFTGKTNLKTLGALMERANFVISGDSGPMHIAVAMKSNVIALFGPTSSRLTGPYGSGNYRVIEKDVGCEVPCYEPICKDYKCMETITVDEVLEVFNEMYLKRNHKSQIPNHKQTTIPNDQKL